MYKSYIQSLFHAIGGLRLPGESKNSYIERAGHCAGLSYSVARTLYFGQDAPDGGYLCNNGQPITKEHREKLEQAAENARDTFETIAFTENQLARWETNPVRFAAHIDAAREYLGRMRQSPEVLVQESISIRNRDAEKEE